MTAYCVRRSFESSSYCAAFLLLSFVNVSWYNRLGPFSNTSPKPQWMCHLKYNSFVYCGQGAHNRLMSALQGKRKIGTQCSCVFHVDCFFYWMGNYRNSLTFLLHPTACQNFVWKRSAFDRISIHRHKHCVLVEASHTVGRYDLQFFFQLFVLNFKSHWSPPDLSDTAWNLVVGDESLDGNEIMVHQPPSPQFMSGRSISNHDILEQLLFSHLWFPFPLF